MIVEDAITKGRDCVDDDEVEWSFSSLWKWCQWVLEG